MPLRRVSRVGTGLRASRLPRVSEDDDPQASSSSDADTTSSSSYLSSDPGSDTSETHSDTSSGSFCHEEFAEARARLSVPGVTLSAPSVAAAPPFLRTRHLSDFEFRKLVLESCLPHNFAAGVSFRAFAASHSLPKVRYHGAIDELFTTTVTRFTHDAVHLQTKKGGEFIMAPETFYVMNPAAVLSRWLHLLESRGRLRKLRRPRILATIFWDAGARTVAGYHVHLLLISFPDLHTSPGCLDSVFPLVLHAGPLPRGNITAKPRPVPPIRERTFSVISSLLQELLQSGVVVPPKALAEEIREAGATGVGLPLEILNISDYASACGSCDEIVLPHVPQFPHAMKNPHKTQFQNRFHYITSGYCGCSIAQQCAAATVCTDSAAPRMRTFFRSPAQPGVRLKWRYGRHGLLHGLPCLLADLSQVFYASGLRETAECLASAFPSPGFDPLFQLRPSVVRLDAAVAAGRRQPRAPVAEAVELAVPPPAAGGPGDPDGGTNACRPPHDVRLFDLKAWIRSRRPATAAPLERWRRADGWRPSPQDVQAILHSCPLEFAVPAACGAVHRKRVGDLWSASVQYSRMMLDGPASDAEVMHLRVLGAQCFVWYKALLSEYFPWRAPQDAAWFSRLPDTLKQAMGRIHFAVNRTALAQSAHEFFVHASRLYAELGAETGSRVQEEAFEHCFLYWWLVSFCMGGMHADMPTRLRFSAMLLWTAAFAGFPHIASQRLRDQEARMYKDKRDRGRWLSRRQGENEE